MIGPQPHSPPPPPSSSSSSPPPPPTNNRLLNLAPGFGFHPTDEELVCYYLKRKSSNLPSITTAIADVDVYKHSPWDLPALSPLSRSSTWYFFTSLDLLPHVSLNPRVHRAAPAGYWKSTGNDRVVRRHSEGGGGGDVVGMKKTLVFHLGRAPQGGRTDWVMHEYRQVEKDNNGRKGCFVLCRVYKKSGHGATRAFYHGAPFVEEEWEGEAATALTCNALSDDVEQATLSLNLVRSNILAPGFRFHPTDEELISYYLKRKALGLPLCVDAIVEVDLYKRAPWQLPPMSPLRDKEWYFFSPLDHKYTNGSRIDRATPHGYWKSTGVDRVIHSHDGSTVIGMKKSLVLHLGRAPHGRRTDWVMHEYFRVKDGKDPIGLFVVCRIFQKSGHGAQRGVHYGAPFVEEEWEEIVAEDSPDASMRDTAGAGEKDHVHSDNAEQGTTKAMFSIGGLVEVAYMNNKLPIAWYTATVIEVVNKNIFLVEYESLRTEDDILLREIVSSQYIRPCPPPTLDKHFNLLDEVEAFYRSGWWQGVIARLNPGSKYNVKLMHWEEEIEFSHTELRLLFDWVDGQWIQSSQDKSIELQDICIPESVDHESNSASTNYENENSDKNELDDFHPCKKARIGAIIKDNTRLVDSRVTNTSSAVNAGFDVRTPILEKEPNSHAKGLVNEGCSAKSLNATNVNSLDSMSRLSSTNLLGEINEDPVVPQKLSQEAVMFQKSPASNREELTKEKSVNTEAQVYERGKYSGVWLLTGYQRRKEPVRECRSQEEEAVRQQTTTEERRENGRPITFSINELSLEGDSVDIKQNNEVVGEPPNQGHSTVQCDTCSDLKALSLVASLVDTSACGVQPITAGREAGNEVLLSIGGNNLAKRGLVQHAEDSAENIQDGKLVEERAIQELSPFQCAQNDNSVNPSSGSIDIGSCEFLISSTNYENKNSDRSTSQNHLEHLHPCKKMKIGETIEGLTNTSPPVKAGFDVRTPIIEEEPNSRIKDFLNKGCCTSSFNMVNVNTRLADAGVTSTSTAVKAGLDVGKPIIEEEPNSCVEASVNMGCSTSSSNMVNVTSLDSMVRLSSSILLGETNEGLVVPESLPQETIMFQKSSGNNGEDSKKKFVNTEGLQTYDGEESGGVCPLTDCQQRKDPVHECLNQGDEAVRQHTTLEEKRGNSRPNTFSIKELSSEGLDLRGSRIAN